MKCLFVGGPIAGELISEDTPKRSVAAMAPCEPMNFELPKSIHAKFTQKIYRAKAVRLDPGSTIVLYVADSCSVENPLQALMDDYVRLAEFHDRYKDYDRWRRQKDAKAQEAVK